MNERAIYRGKYCIITAYRDTILNLVEEKTGLGHSVHKDDPKLRILPAKVPVVEEHKVNLKARVLELEDAIRMHRDARGDDRCWRDDEDLYRMLPEGYTPKPMDTAVEIHNCEMYIKCRQNPATTYVSPQRRIERLETTLRRILLQTTQQSVRDLCREVMQ